MKAAAQPRARDDLTLGTELDFLRLTWAFDHALQRASRRMERRLGVTSPQRLVLRIAGRFPGIPAGRLAKILHLHKSTLSSLLKRLERRGLVARRPDPRDQRRALLGLTARGRQLDVAKENVESAVRAALARLPRGKLRAAEDVLAAMTAALEQVAVQS